MKIESANRFNDGATDIATANPETVSTSINEGTPTMTTMTTMMMTTTMRAAKNVDEDDD